MEVATPNMEEGDDNTNPLADANVNPNINEADQTLQSIINQ